jgi:hypothetical protein
MHVNSLCACSRSEAMKGSSSLRLLILSSLLASPVWAQLTLTDPTWGARSLYLQNGDPFHRVRAHSLNGVQNRYNSADSRLLEKRRNYRTGFRQNIRQENSEILQTRTTVYRTGFCRISDRTGHQEMLYRKTAKSVKREIGINLDMRMAE